MYLRATMWPQPYLEGYPWLCLIPKRPKNPDNYKNVMWWMPTSAEFEQTEGMHIGGVGVIGGANMRLLDVEVHKLMERTRLVMDKRTKEDIPSFMRGTLATLIHTWVRFDGYPATFEEKCLELSEVQRAWLELWAVLDFYHSNRGDIIDNRTGPPQQEARDVMGCLTSLMDVAQRCFISEIPVWLIRNHKVLLGGKVRVDRLVEARKIESEVELRKRDGFDYPVIYRVPHGYTAGTNFLNHTCSGCGYIPYRNFCGFI